MLSEQHKQKMMEGRRRAQQQAQKAAVERIAAFQRWIGSGCSRQHVGRVVELGLPTDSDYKTVGQR